MIGAIKRPPHALFLEMKSLLTHTLCLLLCLTCAIGAGAQKRKVMNRP